jgi:peptide/nickel transport system permease protein
MTWLCRRLLHAVLLLFLISVLSFVLLEVAPGDLFDEMRLNPQISRTTVLALKARYGFDQPVTVKYWKWFASIRRGEFGFSFAYNMPVGKLIRPRAINTLLLTSIATCLSWLAALVIGAGTAWANKDWLRRLSGRSMSLLLSIPEVLLSLGLMMAALRIHLSPARGVPGQLTQGVLPVAALVLAGMPVLVRHTYGAVRDALASPFIQAARAHGISGFRLLLAYALPAAANPLISLLGLSIGGLLSSSVVVEIVMGWPGLGPLFLDAIFSRDIYVVITVTMLSALFLISGNFISDVLLYAADPRIRRSG